MGLAAVVRVAFATGNRTIVSGQGVGAGPDFAAPDAIVVLSDGTIFVLDPELESVIKVDPVTGDRSYLALLTSLEGKKPGFATEESILNNYPNPFNTVTQIGFKVSSFSPVLIEVFDGRWPVFCEF